MQGPNSLATLATLKSELSAVARPELTENFEERGRGGTMLSHCANVQCSKPFLQLGDGKLFLVETERVARLRELTAPHSSYRREQARRVERYWLCDQCAQVWTLVHDRQQGVILLPLPRAVVSARTATKEQNSKTA